MNKMDDVVVCLVEEYVPAKDASVHLGLLLKDVLDDVEFCTIARHGIDMRLQG